MKWSCNVLNCGNGKCVHKELEEKCPFCGMPMIEVTTTGFKFCSDVFYCQYEKDMDLIDSTIKYPESFLNGKWEPSDDE